MHDTTTTSNATTESFETSTLALKALWKSTKFDLRVSFDKLGETYGLTEKQSELYGRTIRRVCKLLKLPTTTLLRTIDRDKVDFESLIVLGEAFIPDATIETERQFQAAKYYGHSGAEEFRANLQRLFMLIRDHVSNPERDKRKLDLKGLAQEYRVPPKFAFCVLRSMFLLRRHKVPLGSIKDAQHANDLVARIAAAWVPLKGRNL